MPSIILLPSQARCCCCQDASTFSVTLPLPNLPRNLKRQKLPFWSFETGLQRRALPTAACFLITRANLLHPHGAKQALYPKDKTHDVFRLALVSKCVSLDAVGTTVPESLTIGSAGWYFWEQISWRPTVGKHFITISTSVKNQK